ncbi:hypothetical protein [Jannaschia aquimarina]|uniref:Uncharacterized protein n=1 Tax=Jannaschia aquimarina TaxID=935700 RepID=A0A0D1D998_9RHOB|nr:hypothetical protein [Jannaschia aquimarina]KIT16473.1 hypothetical protein jaqu_17010 [Jannaschia aquimarina]SNT07722.1 hypothetical protein SAMN05421775_105145 [Jannaschia aquimarina]
MIGLARLALILLVVLTVIYWSLVFYFRAGERERLEKEWHETQPPLPMERFVEIGITEYRQSLRRKLLWGVYVVPITAICTLIYLVNYA